MPAPREVALELQLQTEINVLWKLCFSNRIEIVPHTLTHPHAPSHTSYTLTHPHTPSHTLTHTHTPSHTHSQPQNMTRCSWPAWPLSSFNQPNLLRKRTPHSEYSLSSNSFFLPSLPPSLPPSSLPPSLPLPPSLSFPPSPPSLLPPSLPPSSLLPLSYPTCLPPSFPSLPLH